MIISASYRTDIPAFYGSWLLRRIAAGYCLTRNPYSGQLHRVSLASQEVDGLILWTKNIGPLLPRLGEILDRGWVFAVQHTLNAYPRALETSVLDPARSIAHLQELVGRFGPHVLVWRYDPILCTSVTPPAFHVDTFGRLAAALTGLTDEVVVSFAQIYQKTRRNLVDAARDHTFEWWDPGVEEKRHLLRELVGVAAPYGIRVSVCAQPDLLVPGAEAARCIDATRLAKLRGRPLVARVKGNRPGCACYESRDIGAYDSCPQGCVYCYAVQNPRLAARRFRRHDPEGEELITSTELRETR